MLGHEEGAGEAAAPTNVDYHNLPDGEYRFVEFYAKACPHCVDLQPKWQQAVEEWEKLGAPGVNLKWDAQECLDDNWKVYYIQ